MAYTESCRTNVILNSTTLLRAGRPGDRSSILGKGKDFSSALYVQTSSEAHPASCTMGTGGPFPGIKARPGRDANHSPISSAEVENEQELYLLSPKHLRSVWWDSFSFNLYFTLISLKNNKSLYMS
jgi:hypothetical protein